MNKLALLGGKPVLTSPLSPYQSMGREEEDAVVEVVRSGVLSGFYGSWNDCFLGGPKVKKFEQAWSELFQTNHAVSFNSNTTGLVAAMGAIGIEPGDEVIVSPYTMSATAMAALAYGGIPVFVDVEPETFGLDPKLVEKAINSKTRAILVTNIFGHPARLQELKEIARRNKIFLIEDNAQAPLAHDNGQYCGTIGDIGVFSLNYHKHIHTGEGGMCVTNDQELAFRLQLIRNHAEAVVEAAKIENIHNLFGSNYRLSELSAAIGLVQLKKIEEHVSKRESIGRFLSDVVRDLPGIKAPVVRSGCRHVYYVWAMRYSERELGIKRDTFSKALAAEGFPHSQGYLRPLYLLPIFQKKIAMGRSGFPFNLSEVEYKLGMCPIVESLHKEEVIVFEPCAYAIDQSIQDLLKTAFNKVYENGSALKSWEEKMRYEHATV